MSCRMPAGDHFPGGMPLRARQTDFASPGVLLIHSNSARKPPHFRVFSCKKPDTPHESPAYGRIRLKIFTRGGADKRGPVSLVVSKNRLPGLYPLVVSPVPRGGMPPAGVRNDGVSHSASVVMTQCTGSVITSVRGGVGHGHRGMVIHHCSLHISPEYRGVYWPARERISAGIPRRLARLRAWPSALPALRLHTACSHLRGPLPPPRAVGVT